MGDSIDNVKGVPGIGEKGARELIATYGSLDALLRACRRDQAEEISRRPADPRRRGAAEPRAGDDSHRCGRAVRSRAIPVSRAPIAERCYELFSKIGVPDAGAGVRADSVLGRQGLRARRLDRGTARARRGDERRRAVQHEGDHRRHGAGARDARRHRRLDRGAQRRATSRSATRVSAAASRWPSPRRSRLLAPLLTDPTIEKIGHDLKADLIVLGRHGVDCRNPQGFDTMLAELPGRCEPFEPGARADRARATRLQGTDRRRCARQGRQGDAVRAGAGRQRARLRRRARRPGAGSCPSASGRVLDRRRARAGVSRSRAAAGADSRGDRTHRRPRRRALARRRSRRCSIAR